MPVIRDREQEAQPSRLNDSDNPSDGAHGSSTRRPSARPRPNQFIAEEYREHRRPRRQQSRSTREPRHQPGAERRNDKRREDEADH